MDSRTACDLIDQMFISIKESTWIAQYNFGFANLWHLISRGMSLQRVTAFLTAFNRGVKEKLLQPSRDEAGYEVISQLKEACTADNNRHEPVEKINLMDKYDANFEF